MKPICEICGEEVIYPNSFISEEESICRECEKEIKYLNERQSEFQNLVLPI